jgi:hypothetical protein
MREHNSARFRTKSPNIRVTVVILHFHPLEATQLPLSEDLEKLVYIMTNNLQFLTNSELSVYNEQGDGSDTEGETASYDEDGRYICDRISYVGVLGYLQNWPIGFINKIPFF